MGPVELKRPAQLGAAGYFVVCVLASPALAQQQLHKLVPDDGGANDGSGYSVAISGDLGVLGAIGHVHSTSNNGAAYVFDMVDGTQMREFLATDGRPFDLFGISVGIHGPRVAVGAHGQDARGMNSGAVYVFDAASGVELLKFAPEDLASGDILGHSVAIHGDVALAGAPLHDASGTDAGAAWLFDATSGAVRFKFLASDGQPIDWFGENVALSGDRAIVGAKRADADTGAAYLFDVTTGQEAFKLVASDGQPGDGFGWSVAISAGLALVGSPWHSQDGAAYLFDVSTARELLKLEPPGGGAAYGTSVAINGDRALVGDYSYAQVHVYDVPTGQWLYTLEASDSMLGDRFGWSVALSGARALVGAYLDDDLGTSSGSAYVFAVPQSEGNPYCFGDGSGSTCPCGNAAGPDEGCASSTGSGATLWAAGSPSASADELVVYASQLPHQPALLFAALNLVNRGHGLPFGDGLRCAGGGAVRLGVTMPGPDGTAIWGAGLATRGGFAPGDLRRFQAWYRDPGGPCGSGSNLTSALEVGFTP